jgi:hypothetical protein
LQKGEIEKAMLKAAISLSAMVTRAGLTCIADLALI